MISDELMDASILNCKVLNLIPKVIILSPKDYWEHYDSIPGTESTAFIQYKDLPVRFHDNVPQGHVSCAGIEFIYPDTMHIKDGSD